MSVTRTAAYYLMLALIWVCPDKGVAEGGQRLTDLPRYVELSTPQYRAYEADFAPQMGVYTYEVSWNGIPAAEATLTVGSEDLRYRITASARTYSPINLIYDLRYRADGLIDALDMSSQHHSVRQKENSRERSIDISFREGGEIESVRAQKGKPDQVTKLETNNLTLDPFGAAFLARGLKWEIGETKYFDTFNGKVRYLISLTAEGRETLKIDGEKKECLVISPRVQKVNTNEPQHKLREAKIYVTDDSRREVVKIVSQVFVGAVTTKLLRFEPAATPETIRLAQARARAIIK